METQNWKDPNMAKPTVNKIYRRIGYCKLDSKISKALFRHPIPFTTGSMNRKWSLRVLLVRGTATAVGSPLQQDHGSGRSPAMVKLGSNHWDRHNDPMTAVEGPLQQTTGIRKWILSGNYEVYPIILKITIQSSKEWENSSEQ
ncbi:hypothetical protein HAX54_029840 [Datura stramonium]|uniref:Uncharacterized protein n=1 Tax=Datura stramonium TaxID=4076 RepID=A0ABS8V9E9_DATST|nr:hypothetical protein [Datura stramonium]